MPPVVDASVVISARIADSPTRELILTPEPGRLTPSFVHDELETYDAGIGVEPDRVAQVVALPFQPIHVVPGDDFYPAIDRAAGAIGDTDPDDVL